MNDEVKEKLVLEYTRLCLDFTDHNIAIEKKVLIKIRLNEIRKDLNMELI